MHTTILGLTLDVWAVIGTMLGTALAVIALWFQFRDKRVKLKARVVAARRVGRSPINKPNRMAQNGQRIELHLTLVNEGEKSVFLRSVALRDRTGNCRSEFVSKEYGIQELKSKAVFDGLVDLGIERHDFGQIEPIISMELKACKAICQHDGYLEVQLADETSVTFWAKDICTPNFLEWPDELESLAAHHKSNFEKRRSAKG